MKKVYSAPQFLEIPAEEFYALITEGYGLKDSCYYWKECKKWNVQVAHKKSLYSWFIINL